ncbi:MAG: DUF6236 family protein [Cyanobacteriota bacterium]
MPDNALYFPYINIPNTPWLVRTLLYWDKVVSIVPSEYVYQPNKLDAHMRELVAAELITPLAPTGYIHEIPNFTESFLNYLHGKYGQNSQVKTNRSSSKLHIEKISRISDELIRLGLAEQLNYPWFRVERRVADAFMTYLAATLGKVTSVNAAPVTDKGNSLILLRGNQSKQPQRLKQVREIVLTGLLPSPSQLVELEDLVQFKSKHGQLLSNFRHRIESVCIEISNIEDLDLLEEQIQYKLEELRSDIEQIRSYMRSRWHQVTCGTLVPLLGAGVSLLATPLNPPLAITGAGLSLASAVYQAFSNEGQYREMMTQPLAYAAFAQSHLLRLSA